MLYSLAPNGEWRSNTIVHQSTGGKGVALCCGALRRGGSGMQLYAARYGGAFDGRDHSTSSED